MTARALLVEATRHGVRLYRVGDHVEYEAERQPPADLLARLRAHREELHALLSGEPATIPDAWVIAASGDGSMRLVVASSPPWSDAVFAAAALLEVLDRHHRAGDDAVAEGLARRLEAALEALRSEGVGAWVAS